MPTFGSRSLNNLSSCDPRLIELFQAVVKGFDCSVLCGHRGQEEQEALYVERKTKLHYPFSKHNKKPSQAVDVVPYPIDWENTRRFTLFAGYVLGMAAAMGIPLRWGGDWDRDGDPTDQRFHDLPHFELYD